MKDAYDKMLINILKHSDIEKVAEYIRKLQMDRAVAIFELKVSKVKK